MPLEARHVGNGACRDAAAGCSLIPAEGANAGGLFGGVMGGGFKHTDPQVVQSVPCKEFRNRALK